MHGSIGTAMAAARGAGRDFAIWHSITISGVLEVRETSK